jgi:hypothetical protein
MTKLNNLENKLKELQDALDKADDGNNPHESTRIRREINNTIKDIDIEKSKESNKPVSIERGKELFDKMRQELGLDETICYKEFFNF